MGVRDDGAGCAAMYCLAKSADFLAVAAAQRLSACRSNEGRARSGQDPLHGAMAMLDASLVDGARAKAPQIAYSTNYVLEGDEQCDAVLDGHAGPLAIRAGGVVALQRL
eukprot:8305135-Pyramimonas_sp.AAC.1